MGLTEIEQKLGISDGILPIWQPAGYSTHIIAAKAAEKFGVKTSHTGTLDPMAQGVIIVLLGEERLKKYEFAAWPKTYEFEIVFGVSTDTYDGMGLITEVDLPGSEMIDKDVKKALSKFVGIYEQTVPLYSAIKVKGKPMHWWARNEKLDEIDLPTRKGEILEIEFLGLEKVKFKDVVHENIEKINSIEGDFRQNEIIAQWKEFAAKHGKKSAQKVKIKAKTTKGLYIRTLSQDICKKLDIYGVTTNLIRTDNGKFNESNSKVLEELNLNY